MQVKFLQHWNPTEKAFAMVLSYRSTLVLRCSWIFRIQNTLYSVENGCLDSFKGVIMSKLHVTCHLLTTLSTFTNWKGSLFLTAKIHIVSLEEWAHGLGSCAIILCTRSFLILMLKDMFGKQNNRNKKAIWYAEIWSPKRKTIFET